MNSVSEAEAGTRTLVERLVRARVGISSFLFVGLIAHDIVRGIPPRHGWSGAIDDIGIAGAILILLGLGFRSWAAGILPKGIDLATTGPYSLCRHPLYLGSFAMMVGFCLLLGHLHDYIIMLGPISAIYYSTMRAEERRLAGTYDTRWEYYTSRVPRFIPNRLKEFRRGYWSVTRWKRCREYRALCGGIAALIALEVWRRQVM